MCGCSCFIIFLTALILKAVPRPLLFQETVIITYYFYDVSLPFLCANIFLCFPSLTKERINWLLCSYGHFLCHVFHLGYVLKKGADPAAFKKAMLAMLDAEGAEYPAEHNVGHLYHAKPQLTALYEGLDPLARFNPGIGGTRRS